MMRMLRLFGIILFLPLSGWAAPASLEFYPLNFQTRFERNETQDIQSRQALNFALGGSQGAWGVLIEHSRSNAVSGTEYASLLREHQETLVWGRREVRPLSTLIISVAAGLGFSQDLIQTRFGAESTSDQGQAELLSAVSLGTGIEIQKTLRLSFEGRLFIGGGLPGGPQPDFVLRSGFRF